MLGSANFTSGGFFLNHELSVLIEDDEEVLDDMHQYFDITLDLVKNDGDYEITAEMVEKEFALVKEKKIQYAKDFKKGIRCMSETKFGVLIKFPNKLTEYTYDSVQKIFEPLRNTSDTKYFLKPVGATKSPFEVGKILLDDDMYFSKRYPKAVDKGSILICYMLALMPLPFNPVTTPPASEVSQSGVLHH